MELEIKGYILNEQKEVVREYDFLKWAKWCENRENCRVGIAQFGPIQISTVFLTQPHISNDFDDIRTMFFETMVFADDALLERLLEISETDDRSILAKAFGGIEIQKRYATYHEALEGHQTMTRFVATCIENGLIEVSLGEQAEEWE